MTSDNLRNFVLDSSKGLAEITSSNEPTVQFIHESIRDFLLREGMSKLLSTTDNQERQGHSTMKKICSLQLPLFQDHRDSSIELSRFHYPRQISVLRPEYFKKNLPLLHYAVEYIFHHANWAQKLGLTQVAFLESFDTHVWIQIRRQVFRPQDSTSDYPHLLYFLGEEGLTDLIRVHPERHQHLEVPGGFFGAPQIAALFAGHSAAARAFVNLLPLPGVESSKEAQLKPHRNPALGKETFLRSRHILIFLCEFGDIDILRTILESKQLTMDPSIAKQCFVYATSEDIVDMLAEFGACTLISTDRRDDEEGYPSHNLEKTACSSLTHLEQSLTKHPALIITFVESQTLLNYAAAKRFEHIVKLHVKDTTLANRQKAYACAVRGRINQTGRMSVIRCLAEAGVQSDNDLIGDIVILLFETILLPYNEEVASLLLSISSLYPEVKTPAGLTVLLLAIKHGRKAYVNIFLSAGWDPMARDYDGATALILAVKLSDLSSFCCILGSTKRKLDARDVDGRTALSWCADVADERAVTMIMELLGREDVDPNSEDSSGRTVLTRAVQSGNLKLVKALLHSTRIDPDFGVA